jgi:hypothetical protein
VLVVAIPIGFGLIPIVSPNFFRIFPDVLKPIFGDGIILTSIAAVLLNAFFNRTSNEQAEADTLLTAQAAQELPRSLCHIIAPRLDRNHCQRPQRNTTGSSRRAISINPARVTGCMAGCGARIVSWAMTRPSFIRTLHAAGPHCRFS